MKTVITVCMSALCMLLFAQTAPAAENGGSKDAAVRVLFEDDFSAENKPGWKFNNYQNRLKIERKLFEGRKALVVTNGIGKAMDTAFDLIVEPVEVADLKQYAISFASSASFSTEYTNGRKLSSVNRILFLDADRKLIKAEIFRYSSAKKGYKQNVISGEAPAGTKYLSMAFGADVPDIRPGHYLAIADLKIRVTDSMTSSAAGNNVVFSDDFSKDSGLWKEVKNYKNVLKIERTAEDGKSALVITNASGKNADTSFVFGTGKLDVNGFAQYHISFDLHANYWTADYGKAKRGSRSYIAFYDIADKMIESRPLVYNGSSKTYKNYTYTGKFPAGTASFALIFGGDSPDVKPGKFIKITNVRITLSK